LLVGEHGPARIFVDQSLKNHSFSTSKSGEVVNLKLLEEDKTIEAESVVDFFKPQILQVLRASGYDKLSDEERTELHGLTRPIRDSIKQLVGLLKQELHRYDIEDGLIHNLNIEWSAGDNQWYTIPRELRVEHQISYLGNLDVCTANKIQQLLSENEEALVATSYLHQARKSLKRRYKWTYATIAAGLAIKEVIVRVEPKFQVILGELPSPPLNKLYGDVLYSVAGVRSTGLTRLQNGARKRNQLLHSPKSSPPTLSEVNEYIDFVEDRVEWLLSEWRRIMRAKRQNGV